MRGGIFTTKPCLMIFEKVSAYFKQYAGTFCDFKGR